MNGLSISVLGQLSASADGEPLDLGGRRQRAVLALLIIARGDIVPADRLVDSLWGENPPRSTAGALQAYVSHLRKRLEPSRTARSRDSVILSEGPGYAVRLPAEAVDAWRFEALVRAASELGDARAAVDTLTEALALWRGPAFAEYAAEPWAEAEAARLTDLRSVARERLLAERLSCTDSGLLVPEIEALVAEEPLREERWRLLVLALYRSHRQADALGALRRARRVLSDELGVDPGPALRSLEAEVLAQSPSLDAPAPSASTPLATSQPTLAPGSASPVFSTPKDELVDRDSELRELVGCLDEALDGQGLLTLVEGPAGIGKTRLLAEARRLAAERGALTLTARGSQLEREFGFGAVRQLFEPVLTDPERRARLLSGAAASAESVFSSVSVEPQQRADGSFAVLHGLYWLTVNLAAETPVLLAVDDVQWCDSGSLRFFAYLARRLEGLPVLVAATLRTGEEHDEAALLSELQHDVATVPIRPVPLTFDGVAGMVRGRLGGSADDRFVAACHRTTSGNPLLLRQLLRALEAEKVRPDASHADTVTAIGSRAVSSMVLMRLARLPRHCTAVARAIAVLGDGAALPAVAALAELDEGDAAAALATLSRGEVVRDEYPLGFVHPLVRDAVYRDLPPGERQLQHERAARVLEASGAPAEQVAAHLLQVPNRGDAWVVDVLRRAAATAMDRGTPEGAATYLTRALAEPAPASERPHVLLELGLAEVMDQSAGLLHLRQAYETLTEPAVRVPLAVILARMLVFTGERGEATQFARRTRESLPEGFPDERQGLLALERISGFMHNLDQSVWRYGETPVVDGAGPGARMLATEQAWEAMIDGVDRERAVAGARFALADGVLFREDTELFGVVAAMILGHAEEEVGTFWDIALRHAHARGSMWAALAVRMWRAHETWRLGDLPEALQELRIAHDQSETWGNAQVGVPYLEAYIAGVLLDLGNVPAARAHLDALPQRLRLGEGARLLEQAKGSVLLAEGRYDEARAIFASLDALQADVKNPAWRHTGYLHAAALSGLGRRADAEAQLEAELARARTWGAPSVIGRILRLLGETRGDDGVGDLQEAVSVLSASRARLEYGRALLALGRRTTDSVPLLRQALEMSEACGAAGLRGDVAGELDRAGIPVPSTPSALRALTTSERRIASMSVQGADEREIAQELFVTPRTVQLTLESLRARLDVTSTAELRTLLVAG